MVFSRKVYYTMFVMEEMVSSGEITNIDCFIHYLEKMSKRY